MLKGKQWQIKCNMIFIVSVFMIWVYCRLAQNDTFQLFGMLFSFIILSCIAVLDFEALTKKELCVALLLGLLAVGVNVPLHLMGCLTGVTAFFAYLTSTTLMYPHKEKMYLLHWRDWHDVVLDFVAILGAGVIIFFICWQKYGSSGMTGLNIADIFRSLGAGISEEIIFRMLPYAGFLYLAKGKTVPRIPLLLTMLVPFVMLHVINEVILTGWLAAIPQMLGVCMITVVLIFLAWKRDVFAAMGVHFLYDLILSVFK